MINKKIKTENKEVKTMENKYNFDVSDDDLKGLELMDKSLNKGGRYKKYTPKLKDKLPSNPTLDRGVVGRYVDWDNV
jgi:hypothetical protein